MYAPSQIQVEGTAAAHWLRHQLDDAVERLDRAIQRAEASREEERRLHDQLIEMTMSLRSPDGLAELWCNALGSIERLRFDSQKYQRSMAGTLRESVLAALVRAKVAAAECAAVERRRRGLPAPQVPPPVAANRVPRSGSGDLATQVVAAQAELRNTEITSTAPDGSVSVEVDGRGEFVDVSFASWAVSRCAPEELATTVVAMMRAAAGQAAAARVRTYQQVTVNGAPLGRASSRFPSVDEVVEYVFRVH